MSAAGAELQILLRAKQHTRLTLVHRDRPSSAAAKVVSIDLWIHSLRRSPCRHEAVAAERLPERDGPLDDVGLVCRRVEQSRLRTCVGPSGGGAVFVPETLYLSSLAMCPHLRRECQEEPTLSPRGGRRRTTRPI